MATIDVPAPTGWPFVLAVGFTLTFVGLLTNASVSVLGAVLSIAGSVGWFKEIFPCEHEQTLPVAADDPQVTTQRRTVERLAITPEQERAWLPIHTYPVSAGVKGGWAGSAAMAVLACAYGLLHAGSIWYPINLLAGVALKFDPTQLNTFHLNAFAVAVGMHGLLSTLVGLVYGAMLPMFARRPIVLGGAIAPLLWSATLYLILGVLNPLLASHIDWLWFVASQVAFGVVAGLVVLRQSALPTVENVSFAVRAGIEAPGTISPRRETQG